MYDVQGMQFPSCRFSRNGNWQQWQDSLPHNFLPHILHFYLSIVPRIITDHYWIGSLPTAWVSPRFVFFGHNPGEGGHLSFRHTTVIVHKSHLPQLASRALKFQSVWPIMQVDVASDSEIQDLTCPMIVASRHSRNRAIVSVSLEGWNQLADRISVSSKHRELGHHTCMAHLNWKVVAIC
jgi:hypothetical protein